MDKLGSTSWLKFHFWDLKNIPMRPRADMNLGIPLVVTVTEHYVLKVLFTPQLQIKTDITFHSKTEDSRWREHWIQPMTHTVQTSPLAILWWGWSVFSSALRQAQGSEDSRSQAQASVQLLSFWLWVSTCASIVGHISQRKSMTDALMLDVTPPPHTHTHKRYLSTIVLVFT